MSNYEEDGYYDEYGEWISNITAAEDPNESKIDQEGRLLDSKKLWEMQQTNLPEDFTVFLSKWSPPKMSSKLDWSKSSKISWPDIEFTVELQRFDLYSCSNPNCQLGTINSSDSIKIRKLPNFLPLRSIMFFNQPYNYSKELRLDIAAPPRRNRFIPSDKKNLKDLSDWTFKETIYGIQGAKGVPGALDFFIRQDTYYFF